MSPRKAECRSWELAIADNKGTEHHASMGKSQILTLAFVKTPLSNNKMPAIAAIAVTLALVKK